MGIDQHIKIGVYIECDGKISNNEVWDFQDSIDEVFYHISSEGNGLPKDKDFWGLNKKVDGIFDLNLDKWKDSLITQLSPETIKESIEKLKEEFKKEIDLITKLYWEKGISVDIKFGIINTYS